MGLSVLWHTKSLGIEIQVLMMGCPVQMYAYLTCNST